MLSRRPSWIDQLDEEDVAFIKRLVLASGSLKDLAAAYDISYPTVRLRLDRLIAKVKVLDAARKMGPFERSLRAHFAEGKIDAATLRTLLSAHEKELEAVRDNENSKADATADSSSDRRSADGGGPDAVDSSVARAGRRADRA